MINLRFLRLLVGRSFVVFFFPLFGARIPPCSTGRRGTNSHGMFSRGEGIVCGGGGACGRFGGSLVLVAAPVAGPVAVELKS